ncbi:hypothetical protein [Mariniphaga sediminis]
MPGCYLVKLFTDGSITTNKLIKE